MNDKPQTGKIFWRCHICNDIHYGAAPPEICPTCKAKNAYVEIDPREARKVSMEIDSLINVDADTQIQRWEVMARNEGLKLNSEDEIVKGLAHGVLANEKNHGLKYCPCRITTGDYIKDLELICPCNFFKQKNWGEDGECWCGLFVKG